MEKQFAVKVVQHMSTYWSILEKVKGSSLRLTKIDQEIYDHLMETFPDFDPAATINEDDMKSKAGKDKWRPFMMSYEKKIDDYNFGTMVRNSAKVEYDEDTTIFGMLDFLEDGGYDADRISSPHAVLRHRDCQEQGGLERLDLRAGTGGEEVVRFV